MVMTRRASLLERQRSESVVVIDEPEPKPEVEVEGETDNVRLQSIARESPSLLRPTPQPQEILTIDDDVAHAMSAITIKDEPLDIDEKVNITPIEPPSTSTSTAFSLEVASPRIIKNEVIDLDSEDEEEARDTVGVMRSVRVLPARARGRTSSAGSVVSVEDAKVSIDDFMTDRAAFTADEENKLRFWQSLCIELGFDHRPSLIRQFRLVQVAIDPLPSFDQLSLDMTKSMRKRLNKRANRKANENNSLPPIPTSCAEAKKLLKEKAHVNLVDYFAARQIPLAAGEERDYSDLLHPTREAVVVYSRKTKKYVPRGEAKEEWLQPLLKTTRKNARA